MKLILLLGLAILAGCTTTPPPLTDAGTSPQIQAQQLVQWRLHGRLAFRDGQRTGIIKLRWEQDGERYLIHFTPPVGQKGYALRGDESGVFLLTPENEILYAEDPEALMQEAIGWQVSVNALGHWVRGLTSPEMEIHEKRLDRQGRIITVRQADWLINFKRYTRIDGLALPEKISMHNGELKLTLSIQGWDTQP